VDCTRLAGAKVDTWWLRRHPTVRSLPFVPGLRTQEKINWQVRFIEGGLTPIERSRFAQALTEPVDDLTPDQRDEWRERLTEVAFVSDGYLPFRDNVDHAQRHGVAYLAEPGGSIRSDEIADACREHGITLARTGLRLFHH
jgi:phosphoribosylaminoimidazolecarboxamide formyltransferase/IMP cyclohydrolase